MKLYCVICGSEVVVVRDEIVDDVQVVERSCECGRSSMLHIDRGKLDLEIVSMDETEQYVVDA